jgi:hypothetical protein
MAVNVLLKNFGKGEHLQDGMMDILFTIKNSNKNKLLTNLNPKNKMEDSKHFIKTPVKGDKIKVYCGKYDNDRPEYGIVDHVKVTPKRDIVVLERSDVAFSLNNCDFFLTKSKTKFID